LKQLQAAALQMPGLPQAFALAAIFEVLLANLPDGTIVALKFGCGWRNHTTSSRGGEQDGIV
jgi:hypothetical protein